MCQSITRQSCFQHAAGGDAHARWLECEVQVRNTEDGKTHAAGTWYQEMVDSRGVV